MFLRCQSRFLEHRPRPPPTCNGQVEVLEVLNLPGAFAGSQALIKGFQEVRECQLHVRNGCPPILPIVRPHRTDKQILESKEMQWSSLLASRRHACPSQRIMTVTESGFISPGLPLTQYKPSTLSMFVDLPIRSPEVHSYKNRIQDSPSWLQTPRVAENDFNPFFKNLFLQSI